MPRFSNEGSSALSPIENRAGSLETAPTVLRKWMNERGVGLASCDTAITFSSQRNRQTFVLLLQSLYDRSCYPVMPIKSRGVTLSGHVGERTQAGKNEVLSSWFAGTIQCDDSMTVADSSMILQSLCLSLTFQLRLYQLQPFFRRLLLHRAK